MFSAKNMLRLQDISARIQTIFNICKMAGGIYYALEDVYVYQPAIMLHFITIQQRVEKILFDGENLQDFFSKEDIKGLKTIRNITSHDYDGLNLSIIEHVIKEFLPLIKEKIDKFLLQNGMQPTNRPNIDINHDLNNEENTKKPTIHKQHKHKKDKED